eukprot:scaffold3084_cov144-Cylindrotheca_fusiformis.AAC.13
MAMLPEKESLQQSRRRRKGPGHGEAEPTFCPSSDFGKYRADHDKGKIYSGAYSKLDVGGWLLFHEFSRPTDPIDIGQPSRASLQFVGLFGEPREAIPYDEEDAELNWKRHRHSHRYLDPYYEFDEDLEDTEVTCRRANWKHLYRPNCNSLHELDLMNDYPSSHVRLKDTEQLDSFYISHGYFRDVWVVESQDGAEKTVLKVSRWKHDFGKTLLHEILRDALIMERMTHSPRIVDIFGHCGTAVRVEAIPYEVEEVIVPDGNIKQEKLHDEYDVQPQNSYTATEKLEIALDMAESLADLHGFEDGIIVHDDVQLCQWLRKKDGTLKLGDFNRAEIMDYNVEKNEYCKYVNGECFGNYRAPEEFAEKPLDEKIDIWSFGNNMYALLTGLWIFYENDDDDVIHTKLIDGKTAYIDPRYKKRSYAEQQLVKLIKQCWKYNPEDRPSIFELVDQLRKAVSENLRLKGPGEEEPLAITEDEESDDENDGPESIVAKNKVVESKDDGESKSSFE